MSTLILASGSAIRAAILRGAGVPFEVIKPGVDEDVIKKDAAANGLNLEATAQALADAKALAVSTKHAGLVLGSDQILEFEGGGFDKPADMAEAKERLMLLQGASHRLLNGVAFAQDGEIVERRLSAATLYVRPMDEAEIDAYLAAAGPAILSSVGAYQVEGLGARLFDRIDGDYFTVLGLSLFPTLDICRRHGVIPF